MPARPQLMATYEWVCETDGVLSRAERGAFRAGMRSFAWETLRGCAASLVKRSRPLSFQHPELPDGKVARIAIEAAAYQGAAIVFHGYRTWLFGMALAETDSIEVDPELLFVTALLHDAGMLERVPGEDFTRRSADRILRVFDIAGAPRQRGMAAADAAVAHATPGLDRSGCPLGYYVQAGAMADLAKIRTWDLPKAAIRLAYATYPALGFRRTLSVSARQAAIEVPDGRMALLSRKARHASSRYGGSR